MTDQHSTTSEGDNIPPVRSGQPDSVMQAMRAKSAESRKKRMEERQDSFITLLAQCNGVIAQAMREDGAPVWRTLTRWRKEQPAFEERIQECIHTSMERLHEVAVRLAHGDANTPPSENMLRFVLSHCSEQYKKNSEQQSLRVELSVERKQEQVDDLRRLLGQQEKQFIEGTAKEGVGGGVTASPPPVGPPEVPPKSAERHDKNEPE